MKSILRYHRNVFLPEQHDDRLRDFIFQIMHKKIVFSAHALQRYRKLKRSIKTKIKSILHNSIPMGNINEQNVFETYVNSKTGEITKAGIRFPVEDSGLTIVLIISVTGKIVTIYVNNIDDNHSSLNEEVYEKGA